MSSLATAINTTSLTNAYWEYDLKTALLQSVNSALLTLNNHTTDNSFLFQGYRGFERRLEEYNYEPVGVTKNVPYNPYPSEQLAFVYRFEGELYWFHLPKRCWEFLLLEGFGCNKIKDLGECLNSFS